MTTTVKKIESVIEQAMLGDAQSWTARNSYLRLLAGQAVKAAGLTAAKRTVLREVSEEDKEACLAALNAAHAEYYQLAVGVAERIPIPSDDERDREIVVRSRTGFVRSAASTLRAFVARSGYDLSKVNTDKLSKAWLAEHTPASERSGSRGTTLKMPRLLRSAQGILDTITASAKTDREKAIEALQDVINMLTHGFDDLGMPAVSIRDAVDNTATSVIAEAARRMAATTDTKRLGRRAAREHARGATVQ